MSQYSADQPTLPGPQQNLVDALAQSAFAVTSVLTRIGAGHDLSLTQLRVLGILRDRRLRMSELADYLGLEKSTMSGLIDRAEKRGLLGRAASPSDGRAVHVGLTPAGSELAGRLFAEVAAALTPLTDTLAPADQRRLNALLSTMLATPASGSA